jgi:hypothetical protein
MKYPTDDSTFDMFGFYGSKGHEMARLSSDRADRELGDWSTKAHNFLMQFARLNQNPFLVEEARAYAELCGLKAPPDGRAWGHIVQTARREQLLVSCGYGIAKSSNGSPKVLWKLKGTV